MSSAQSFRIRSVQTGPALRIVDPGLHPRHPRQVAHRAFMAPLSTTWFAEGEVEDVLGYLLPLLGLTAERLRRTRSGFSTSADRSVLLVGLEQDRFASITAVGSHGGSGRIDVAVARENDERRRRLLGGDDPGHPTVTARVRRGVVESVSAGSTDWFVRYVAGAEVAALDGR
ncbi:hypothetical protein [Nocardioides flavescens]|uniref:Uncharacterized protein n=1 Tax=Nocardioides flavescens TaxID=2691959 RepID=A0A6L7ETW0_9ACTN|nr:hypothetical protein [Nocardioides flavescens]MXG89086.1 hypothetical protein [Nocardioides flavescens]